MLIILPIALFSDLNPTMLANPVDSGILNVYFEINEQGRQY
jgi:hypothetical protein